MRREVKKAKAMVKGNLIRKLKKLNMEKNECSDDVQSELLDNKIEKILKRLKIIKVLDCYQISRDVTKKPDIKHWNRIKYDSKSSDEDILIASIVTKNNIQQRVMIFRNDHQDLDEWFDEYIEYREKKKDIINGQSLTDVEGNKRNINKNKKKKK